MHRALLALVLASVLAGCGSEEEGQAPAPATVSAPAAPATTSPTAADLPELAVGLADLPGGFSIRREGVVSSSGTVVAAFRRSFDPGQAKLGESALAELASDVALFESPGAAQSALERILADLVGQDVETTFAGLIRVYVGIEATNLDGETLAVTTIGDNAVIGHATFDTDAGRAEAVLVVVRVRQLHQALFLLGPAGSVRVDDATALARAVVPRMRSATESELAV